MASNSRAVQSVAVVVTNAEATYLLKRPRDFAPGEIAELVALAESREYVELYRRSRVPIRAGRTAAPLDPPFNLDVNRWSLYDPAGTYFLPEQTSSTPPTTTLVKEHNAVRGGIEQPPVPRRTPRAGTPVQDESRLAPGIPADLPVDEITATDLQHALGMRFDLGIEA